MDKLKQRLIGSTFAMALLILMISISHTFPFQFIFVIFCACISSFALKEFYQLATVQGYYPNHYLGIASNIAFTIAAFLAISIPKLSALPEFVLLITLATSFILFFRKGIHPLVNISITVFGIAYLTVPLISTIYINYMSHPGSSIDGRIALAYVIFVTKATDMGGYFIGKGLGKTRLAPILSPKKTVEGALGGILTGLFASLMFHSLIPISIIHNLILGLIFSIVSEFGDLAESLLKRDSGVKDSNEIPGFGGILDLVDSLVFTLPLMYLFMKMGWV